MTSTRVWPLAVTIACLAASAPAFAHHSAAMFDATKTVTMVGAVKTFTWANPHATIEMVAVDDKGVQQVWNFECSTPNILVRKGWSIKSFKPGDMIKVTAHPLHDGGQAGLLMNVSTAGGAVLKDHDY